MQVIIDGVEYSPKAKVEMKPMTFGGLLKSVRNALDMTLDQACIEIGCSKSNLWELENDNSEPSFRTAKKISSAYGIELITLASYLPPNVK